MWRKLRWRSDGIEGPIEGYVTVIVRARLPKLANWCPAHPPGDRISNIHSGDEERSAVIDGFPDKLCKAGDWFQVPLACAHSVASLGRTGRLAVGNLCHPKGRAAFHSQALRGISFGRRH